MCSLEKNKSAHLKISLACVQLKVGGNFPQGKNYIFVFLSLNPCCYLDNILHVPPGRPSEDEDCGRRV